MPRRWKVWLRSPNGFAGLLPTGLFDRAGGPVFNGPLRNPSRLRPCDNLLTHTIDPTRIPFCTPCFELEQVRLAVSKPQSVGGCLCAFIRMVKPPFGGAKVLARVRL